MKKLALVAAVAAATLSSGAFASRPYTASFSGVQMIVGGFDITAPCPAGSTSFTIDGADPTTIQMLGDICLDPTGTGSPFIKLSFNTLTGDSTVGGGTLFTGGSIQIDAQTSNGWLPYATVVASTTNLDCTNAGVGLNGAGTFGLQVPSTTITVPGFWNGNSPDATEALAICETNLFSQVAQLFIGP